MTPNKFDGVWIVREVCEKNRIWRADTYQFAGKIKDSMFHFQFGSEGEANSGTYDGKIGVDGSAEINVKGLTGDPAYDPLHRPLGTGYHYKIAIKLDEARGAGIRIETPRPCRSEWSKLSPLTTVTPTPDSNAPASPAADDSGVSLEKEKPGRGAKATDGKHPKPESEPSQDRQITTGLSCSKSLEQMHSGLRCKYRALGLRVNHMHPAAAAVLEYRMLAWKGVQQLRTHPAIDRSRRAATSALHSLQGLIGTRSRRSPRAKSTR